MNLIPPSPRLIFMILHIFMFLFYCCTLWRWRRLRRRYCLKVWTSFVLSHIGNIISQTARARSVCEMGCDIKIYWNSICEDELRKNFAQLLHGIWLTFMNNKMQNICSKIKAIIIRDHPEKQEGWCVLEGFAGKGGLFTESGYCRFLQELICEFLRLLN